LHYPDPSLAPTPIFRSDIWKSLYANPGLLLVWRRSFSGRRDVGAEEFLADTPGLFAFRAPPASSTYAGVDYSRLFFCRPSYLLHFFRPFLLGVLTSFHPELEGPSLDSICFLNQMNS